MLESTELYSKLCQDLVDRRTWAQRQELFYRMRHHGIRRRNKPGAWASDVHVPIGDTIITNLKPYYVQQLYALDTLATFVSQREQHAALTSQAAHWFDYKLKNRSNLQYEMISAIDWLLVCGRGVLKTMWDHEKGQLRYASVNPSHIIAPWNTGDTLEDADRFAHVQIYTPESLARHPGFTINDPELIKKITGTQDDKAGNQELNIAKQDREGLLQGREGEIVVWEVYEHLDDGEWNISWMSPTDPEIKLRDDQEITYDHGQPPFTSFTYEIKDKGWYSPRGVMEQIAVFENSATKTLNEKHDAMTFFNRPMFTNQGGAQPNSANIKFTPGQVLPDYIQPIPMPNPPISFDQHMVQLREMAQQRVSTPDFGISSSLDSTDRRTATEIHAIGNLFSQSSDLRMRVFRLALTELYKQSWSLLLQYDKSSLNYYYQDTLGAVPQHALHEDYEIEPTGSADGVNKLFHYQKAVQRFQMFAGDPFVDQAQLRRGIFEADDASLVKTHLIDPNFQASDQAEEQAMELSIMLEGFPAQVSKADDDEIHIQTVVDYMSLSVQQGKQISPVGGQRILEHIQAHIANLAEKDGAAAKRITNELQQFSQTLQQVAQAQQSQPGSTVDGGGLEQSQGVPGQPIGAEAQSGFSQ